MTSLWCLFWRRGTSRFPIVEQAKQQGTIRWGDLSEFVSLLEVSDVLDHQMLPRTAWASRSSVCLDLPTCMNLVVQVELIQLVIETEPN